MSKFWQTPLLWLGVLLVFLAAAPVQAARPAQARIQLAVAGEPLTLCVAPATATALAQSPSLPALLAAARAPGATRCKPAQGAAAQQAAPRGGLMIDFGDGRVLTFCIDLGADGQASGEELLRASKLPVVIEYSGLGGAVCKIDGVGADFRNEPCFAKCTLRPGEPCLYWAYSRLADGAWQTSQLGAGSTTIHAGEVDGWAWGQGSTGSGAQPPVRTFEQICAVAVATPSPTATQPPGAAPSALPQQFVTVAPSATPAQSPTATRTPALALAQPSSTAPPTRVAAAPLPGAAPTSTPAPAAPAGGTATPAPPTSAPASTATREVRVQIPVAQNGALAAGPSAAPAPNAAASPAPMPTTIAQPAVLPEPAAPASGSPARNYSIFAALVALLLAAWVWLRQRRKDAP